MKYTFIFLLIFLRYSFLQATIISGEISANNGDLIYGANVYLQDSYDGCSTDSTGSFSFNTQLTGSQVLIVSYIGYQSYEKEIDIKNEKIYLEISLVELSSELNPLTITAGVFEASEEKKSVVLKPIDIVTTAGALADIQGAFNTLPGTHTVGEEGKLFVRGGDSYETKTFVDGLQVRQPYGINAPDVPARGRFSPFLFDGMVFSSGGYSAEYGQALSSALILNTADLAEKTETGISLMSLGLGLSHTQKWDHTSLSVSGNFSDLQPMFSLLKKEYEWNNPPETIENSVIFRHEFSDTGLFKFFNSYSDNKMGLVQHNINSILDIDIQNKNEFGTAYYEDLLNDNWKIESALSYSNDHKDILLNESIVKEHEKAVSGKVVLDRYFSEAFSLKFGAESIYQKYQQDYRENVNTETYVLNFNDVYLASFVQSDIQFNSNLLARLGARYEHNTVFKKSNIAPRLSLAYKTGNYSQVSFAWGQYHQTPDNEYLKYNQNLNYEKATHFITNYQVTKNKRTFRIEGYYKKYRDLIKYKEPEQSYYTNINNEGKGYARGIEIFWRDSESLKWGDYWISYSYLDTKRNYRDFPQMAVPGFASNHNLSLVYKQFIPFLSSQVGATYSMASGRPYHNPNQDGFNQGKTPFYNDLSLNISYITKIMDNLSVIYFSMSNIPGFNNIFGYRYNDHLNSTGGYERQPIQQDIKSFVFLGLFININHSEDKILN